MKSLNEFIARKANREDGCTGRFWEGRFKCQRLEGEAAVLSCAVYIDLNPVRAKKADTPETSKYTSAYERIHALQGSGYEEPELWLAPIQDTGTRRGFLSISLREYLKILDTTGRQLRRGKRGKIPDSLAPILVRLGIEPEAWLESSSRIGKSFSSVVGTESSLREAAASLSKSWLKGLQFARRAFA